MARVLALGTVSALVSATLATGLALPVQAGDDYVSPPQEVVRGLVLKPKPEPRREPRPQQQGPAQSALAQEVERRTSSGGGSGGAGALTSATEMDVRMVHANIKSALSDGQFAADLRTATAGSPDFVTLNEATRSPDMLALPGYAFHRGTDSRWAMETTVMWATDRWESVSTGTRYLHRREGTWGTRAVNWVTLRSYETGKVVSVISTHASPVGKGTPDLIGVYTSALSALVRELGAQGPVFAGGDLNVHYNSGRFPRGGLQAGGLATTYDVHGMPAGGTGDHGGHTIDYLLFQPSAGVTSTSQAKTELASDHDAVAGAFHLEW